MSRESRIVSPLFHSVYIHVSPFYFRIGLQMQKGERLLGEREFMLVGCSNTSATILLSLPTIYPPFARYNTSCLTFHHFFFIITFCYNNKIVINIYFFYSYAFFHVHSKSYTLLELFLRGIEYNGINLLIFFFLIDFYLISFYFCSFLAFGIFQSWVDINL